MSFGRPRSQLVRQQPGICVYVAVLLLFASSKRGRIYEQKKTDVLDLVIAGPASCTVRVVRLMIPGASAWTLKILRYSAKVESNLRIIARPIGVRAGAHNSVPRLSTIWYHVMKWRHSMLLWTLRCHRGLIGPTW